jgi:DNA-binding NtrC family response regulator
MNAISERMIGHTPAFAATMRAGGIVAATGVSLLLLGEPGTGKRRFAEAIHAQSPCRNGPFVALNCALIEPTLMESRLFGAVGATPEPEPGAVTEARGGTLFLEEVRALPLPIQARLLRLLESGETQAKGELRPRRVEVRVIAASSCNLSELVSEGAFRQDLYYRLHVVPLELPPLRERREDIPLLLRHLTDRFARRHGLTKPRYSTEMLRLLGNYGWPGNLRELRNLAERMVLLLPSQEIGPLNLPAEVRNGNLPAPGPTGFRLPDQGVQLEALEVDLITQALERTRGNRSRAARLLGLTRDTLLYRIKKYAL